jgi:hypothetical protein
MTFLQTRIQEAASQRAPTVQGLSESDSAPSQLEQQTAYIANLDTQLVHARKRVKKLTQCANLESRDQQKSSESTFRRFTPKASDCKERFAEKAAKEAREHFDAIQA